MTDSVVLTKSELEVLRQAMANYEELWRDFLIDIDDGRWVRAEVETNITRAKNVLGMGRAEK